MRITGKWEFEVVPAREAQAHEWVEEMERDYERDGHRIRYYLGPGTDHGLLRYEDRAAGGVLDPFTGQIHIFFAEESNLAVRAEELAHYFQYKAQNLLGLTEEQIGRKVIDANEKEIKQVLEGRGFRICR